MEKQNRVYSNLSTQSNWWCDNHLSLAKLPIDLRELICQKGSLTEALISLGEGTFAVDVLNQYFAVPRWHEQKKMEQPFTKVAMIRQVELKIFDEAVVYARSIIPLSLASKGRAGLVNLGRTPLGHLLFKDGKIRVSKREFSVTTVGGHAIAARRTPYDYQGSQILVSEFFLPSINKYL